MREGLAVGACEPALCPVVMGALAGSTSQVAFSMRRFRQTLRYLHKSVISLYVLCRTIQFALTLFNRGGTSLYDDTRAFMPLPSESQLRNYRR